LDGLSDVRSVPCPFMYSVHVVPHHAGDGKWLVEVTGQEEK
jgi:hypothetical protein